MPLVTNGVGGGLVVPDGDPGAGSGSADAVVPQPLVGTGNADVVAGFRVDPHWRNTHGGLAVRLDARTTIDVAAPVGRWREVDPRRPHDTWRSIGKAAGLAGWMVAVAGGWWLGSSRGGGPLGVLRRQ